MQNASFSDAARMIDNACMGFIASGEVDPTRWLDQVSNYLLGAPKVLGDDEALEALLAKLVSDEATARRLGTLARAEFYKAAKERVDELAAPYPADDVSELGPTFKPYPPR